MCSAKTIPLLPYCREVRSALGVRLRKVAVELAQGSAVDLLAPRGLAQQGERRHPLGRHLELVDDGEGGRDLAQGFGVLPLIEKEVRKDEAQGGDVGAHAEGLELLLRLAIGPDGGLV